MRFLHEKYENLWWKTSMLAVLILFMNRLFLKSDVLSILVFVLYAILMSFAGIMNRRYKEKR
jgi:hypothetical protein